MKIAIVGGGAMGTLLGAHLCVDHNVSVIDQGARCKFIRASGLILLQPEGGFLRQNPDLVTDNYAAVGPQDYVLLTVKAYDLPRVAENIGHLLGEDTVVVTIQNGIPWWYFQKYLGQFENLRLESVDPRNNLTKKINADRIVGCVAYPAAELLDDGSVRHVEGYRLPVGELDGQVLERTSELVKIFERAGFRSRAISDIRSEYWLKAWGALSINPISALTHGRIDAICSYNLTKCLVENMMKEAAEVANSFGATFRHTIEKRIESARNVGPHKTSMLCDLEAGGQLEVEALIGSIVELAKIAEQPVPSIEAIYACISLLNEKTDEMSYQHSGAYMSAAG
jgi:2-dehydropantoate 2-reductase